LKLFGKPLQETAGAADEFQQFPTFFPDQGARNLQKMVWYLRFASDFAAIMPPRFTRERGPLVMKRLRPAGRCGALASRTSHYGFKAG
jgi:hypothetical protein